MYRDILLKQLEHLDKELEQLFSDLSGHSEASLKTKKDDSQWSPIEILQHLLISERLSLAYCEKKLSFKPNLKKKGFRSMLSAQLVGLALISPFKFKAPKAVAADQFNLELSLEDVKQQWLASRKKLHNFLATVSDDYVDCEIYKHPFGVRLSLGGMLNFFLKHFHRHRRQLQRRL